MKICESKCFERGQFFFDLADGLGMRNQILNELYWIFQKVGYIANLHNVAYEGEDDPMDHPYITSAKEVGGWIKKNVSFC
jgi:hypothetical protein